MRLFGAMFGAVLLCACGGNSLEEEQAISSSSDALEQLRHRAKDRQRCSSAVLESLRLGAARLSDLQADTIGDNARNGLNDADPDDSGWDWTLPGTATSHTPIASPTNLFGGTGLGIWAALQSRPDQTRLLISALDVGVGIQRNLAIDSPPDFVYGTLLAELTGDDGFAQLARDRYDAKRAAAGGATAMGTKIRDQRHAANHDGLIAYDLGWLSLAAAALDAAFPGAGYKADASAFAKIVVDDLTAATPRFNSADPHEAFYVTCLAWSLVATSWHAKTPLFQQLRGRLLDQQHANGAWAANADQTADDQQSTAHALQTLAITEHATNRTRKAARRAAAWLISQQQPSGGWLDPSNVEVPLVNADILLGLMLSQTDAGAEGVVPGAQFKIATGQGAPHAAPIDW